MLSIMLSLEQLESALARGAVGCPGCGGRLARWGYARSREVRMLCGVRSVRPRRTSCRGCGATHVLLPAWSVARRRDGAEVIGEALALAAGGDGHRQIACRLDRPAGTARGQLRAAPACTQRLCWTPRLWSRLAGWPRDVTSARAERSWCERRFLMVRAHRFRDSRRGCSA
jgi:hypothetical protein